MRALLVYLAVETPRVVHSRNALAALLWPGYGDANARTNLRQTLHHLRKSLGESDEPASGEPDFLLVTRQTIQFNSAADCTVDVRRFTDLLAACSSHTHDQLERCLVCLARMRQAAELYRGDFVAGFAVDDSAEFEEWRRIIQERLHLQALDLFTRLANVAEAAGEYDLVRQSAQRLLAMEPWREEAHRQLMRVLAVTGHRHAAMAQYQACWQLLQRELGVGPDAETSALYEQIRGGQFDKPASLSDLSDNKLALAPAPIERPPLDHRVTQPLVPLLGRDDELAQIEGMLAQPTCRLITLVGPPGVGKTLLAHQALIRQRGQFADDIWFLDLAPINEPALVPPTLAQAFGLHPGSTQPVLETLIAYLADKAILLGLDNFEQVMGASHVVTQLLRRCPKLKILVTSRVPLQVPREQSFPVEPLATPVRAHFADSTALMANAAVQLFCQRATAVLPTFQLTDANAQAVAEICVHLDGLPLAIELAAARSRLLTPAAILARLESRFDLLTSSAAAVPARQQTLAGAIAWSHALLSTDEQLLFRSLAVFAGSFTLATAEAIIGGSDGGLEHSPLSILNAIESLIDKNLLRRLFTSNEEDGEPRFTMLESIRAYGRERLAANPNEAEALYERHARFFLALIQQVEPKLSGPEQVAWLNHIELEHDNLRAAQQWFLIHDPQAGLALAATLRNFWRVRAPGPYTGMNITGVTGISEAQKAGLVALGASIDEGVALSPPMPSTPPPHNLPVELTPLVGRKLQLAELSAQLQQPSPRLLTLVGAGGMGKTRLALALAQTAIQNPRFPDGVFFVSLASLANPAALTPTITTTLGLAPQGGDPSQALLQSLHHKRLLLILDNFEHLLAGAGLVADLLQMAQGVRIIVTSRERLNLQGEHLYLVPPLDFAPSASSATAPLSASAQLFVQSAQRTQPSFAVNPANTDAVLRICQLVQGMPLGLELAAAYVGTLPLPAIAAEIEQSTEFLAVDWRNVPERQRSMQAVFAWSWQLLSESERRVLRQISVFRGGFTAEAAQAVIGARLTMLARLAQKSLLYYEEMPSGGGRYKFHELLRQFAAEQLDISGERAEVEAQHGRFYLAYLAHRGLRLVRGEPRQASEEIQTELDNIRQAWRWAVVHAQVAELDQAVYGWWQFCLMTGLAAEAGASFDLAAGHVRRWLSQTPEPDPQFRSGQRLLGKLLALYANHLFAHSQWEQMAALAQEAITLSQASDGPEGEALGYFVFGRALQELERPLEAKAMYEQATETARQHQQCHPNNELLYDVEWMGHVWRNGMLSLLGDHQGGRESVTQALRICRSLGKRRAETTCLINLAEVNFQLGDYTAARQEYEEALPLCRAIGYTAGEALAQRGYSEILRLQGEYTQAQMLLESAVTSLQRYGRLYDAAWALAALVRLHCRLGDRQSANARLGQLDQLIRERELTLDCQAQYLLALVAYAQLTGDSAQALAAAERGWQLSDRIETLSNRAHAAVILGHARADMAQWSTATTAYQQAISIYQQIGNTIRVVEPQAGLAQIALAQDDRAEAQRLTETILPILAEHPRAGFDRPFFTWLTCHQVLAANQDPRARDVLQTAYRLLQQDADSLQDAAARRLFLEEVASHRALQQAYTEM